MLSGLFLHALICVCTYSSCFYVQVLENTQSASITGWRIAASCVPCSIASLHRSSPVWWHLGPCAAARCEVPGMNGRIFPRELLNNILLMFS